MVKARRKPGDEQCSEVSNRNIRPGFERLVLDEQLDADQNSELSRPKFNQQIAFANETRLLRTVANQLKLVITSLLAS